MSDMRVVGVRVELPANHPILLLRETEGERYLPIWIGSVEATAIALEQQGVRPPRPLTHDLLKEIISALGRELEQVRITDLQEGTFFAELVFDGDVRVSARPSDSVALALRCGLPIHAEESVLAGSDEGRKAWCTKCPTRPTARNVASRRRCSRTPHCRMSWLVTGVRPHVRSPASRTGSSTTGRGPGWSPRRFAPHTARAASGCT